MLTLVLGGARSGKSRYAQTLCTHSDSVVYIATARPDDDEMRARIARHRADRPVEWITLEVFEDVPRAVQSAEPHGAVVLVDCITVWLSNLSWVHREMDPPELETLVLTRMRDLADASEGRTVIVVSNEVGQSLVPESPVGRQFRDLQGLANQALAAASDKVILMVAGLPLVLK
jgi:adenosylcobinamide kinase / adenosylcobinamide-phosphate guanylyltransferase